MFYGIDALVHGAVVALAMLLPAAILFWLATEPMRGGSRALRALVIGLACWGAMMLAAGAYGTGWERRGYADEALMGGVIGGGVLAGLLFLLLLVVLPRAAKEPRP